MKKRLISALLLLCMLAGMLPLGAFAAKNPFTDVKNSDYYYDAVLWTVERGITNGTDAVRFSPDARCTRAQVVTFLWRAMGQPNHSGKCPFTDVSDGQYYRDAVVWAAGAGVTTGTSATTFSPDVAGGKGRIYAYFREKHSPKEQTEFLKKEYGIGGSSHAVSGATHSGGGC